MRWMWTLVVCCLVALGGVRPQLEEVRDPYGSQTPSLDAAPARIVALATRRDTTQAPDLRLPPFVLISPPGIASPARRAIAWEPRALAGRLALVVSTSSARGPPVS